MPAMFTTTLNPLRKTHIQSMDAAFPLDDADAFAVFEIDGIVRSAAAFLQEDEETYECYAFTDPDYRQEGLFTELLELAIDELPEDTGFIFYTKGTDPDTMAALDALEAECILEEHMMELALDSWSPDTSDASDLQLTMTLTTADGTLTRQYENKYGSVNISVFSGYYYLYGFEILEEYRGQGHGNRFLTNVLQDLAVHNPLPLRLQVSGENLPAVSLYKKTGFQITETLFGYLY